VQVIDDWFTSRKLGLAFEVTVESGRLLVCSMNLNDSLRNPVARQMLQSLLHYMGSESFHPNVQLSAAQVRGLIREPTPMEKLGARVVRVDSETNGTKGEYVLDGDSGTIWHTAWEGSPPEFPHEITLEFGRSASVRGFTALPRQDANHNGWIKTYELYASADGREWGEPVARGAFDPDASRKTVMLREPVNARYVRLVALTGHEDGPWASLAEFTVIE
jgi:hypothetical protein